MVVLYTASLMATSAAPVFAGGFNDGLKEAPPVESLPLEPDTQFDANRWYDQWWNDSIKGMKNIPSEFVKDLDRTYSALKSIFNNGVKVGNVMIVRGGPDTARIFGHHMKAMGVHYMDTIRMFPEHAQKVGQHFADAGKDIARVASKNAKHTAGVASRQGKAIAEDSKQAVDIMGDIANWMGRSYVDVAKDTAADVKEDAYWTKDKVGDAARWTRDEVADAFTDTTRWMSDYAKNDIELTKKLAEWTVRQAPEGYRDTVQWTTNAAKATGRWTSVAANWTADETVKSVDNAGKKINDALYTAKTVTELTADVSEWAGDKTQAFFEDALKDTAKATLGKIPNVAKNSTEDTKKAAKWLWKKGYEEGVKGGLELAGDNYFAGDVEGIAVGTFYGLTAAAYGVGYILVLEPLAFTGTVGWGVTKTVGVTVAGTAATAAVAATGVAANVGVKVGGAVLTTGVAALAGAYTAGTAVYEGMKIAGTATAGGLYTAGAAVTGGAYTVGAAGVGAVRTVGGVAIGGVATAAVGGVGLVGGEVALGTAGVVRMAGTAMAGTVMTAGAAVAGGLKMTGDVAWGATKMVGVTAAGAAGEILVPTIAAGMTVGRAAYVAGTAVVDNAIITPAVATWDILTALTLGGWELAKDPLAGTYHLVAGTTGFAYRLVGLTTSLALTATAGVLYAVAKAPLSLVYYGGMWTIAAGAKLLDGIIAPLKFDTQNKWKNERLPQLEEILSRQGPSILSEIGTEVSYLRVVFSGEDRGKVNFFTTEKDGHKYKFKRAVRGNCLVVYTSKDTQIVLDSGQYERKCMERK